MNFLAWFQSERMSKADAAAWASARTLTDLGHLTAAWLEGDIASQPGYMPRCGPDPETLPLIPVLAAVNRAGFVTNGSQPGGIFARSQQRAAVEGFASARTALHLVSDASAAGLWVVAHNPRDRPGRRIQYEGAVDVTRMDGYAFTSFGAHLSRAHLTDSWTGYGICHADAVEAVCRAWQVTIIDPEWGRNDRLWPVLEQFAQKETAAA